MEYEEITLERVSGLLPLRPSPLAPCLCFPGPVFSRWRASQPCPFLLGSQLPGLPTPPLLLALAGLGCAGS